MTLLIYWENVMMIENLIINIDISRKCQLVQERCEDTIENSEAINRWGFDNTIHMNKYEKNEQSNNISQET